MVSTMSCRKAIAHGVMIVSPTLLMLAIQVVQQIQKDARMREAADQILKRGRIAVKDVERLKRARRQARQRTSARPAKTSRRSSFRRTRFRDAARRSRDVEFEGDAPDALPAPIRAALGAAE